jgi:hypothetical protein
LRVTAPSAICEHPAAFGVNVARPDNDTRQHDEPRFGTPPTRHVLLTHRICALPHAATVRRLCRTDTNVLPRWHQDDRGPKEAHRGIHVHAPDGAYSTIPVWTNRDHWLDTGVPMRCRVSPGLGTQ